MKLTEKIELRKVVRARAAKAQEDLDRHNARIAELDEEIATEREAVQAALAEAED